MVSDVLPSSRLQRAIGSVRRPDGWWQPIFCANCGGDGGLVPEENATFAFYLCNSCAATYGDLAHTYMMPDAEYFRKVSEVQLERYGRYLNPVELLRALEDTGSPLAKLAREKLKVAISS